MSAYEEAVAEGFVGTFEDWQNSLIGDEITDNSDPIEATDRLIVERSGGALQSVPVSQLPASGGGMTNPMTTAGDLIVGGASGAPTRLAGGTDGHVLTRVAGANAWAAPTGGGYSTAAAVRDALETLSGTDRLDASAIQNLPEGGGSADIPAIGLWDFWNLYRIGTTNVASGDLFLGAAVSSGTNNTAIPAGGLSGYNGYGVFLRSSTTANGGYRYQTSSLVTDYFGTISHKFRFQFLWRTAFTGRLVRGGFHDTSTNADATDGAYFEIDGDICRAKTANNGTRTTHATTITLALDTAYTFDIDVNAAGTEARFRVYSGTNYDTPLMDVTITTNIPTTSARAFGAGVVATESSTTASDIGILYSIGVGTVEGFARAHGIYVPLTAPAAFTVGQWDAQPTVTPGEMEYQIDALPNDGGSPITALEYRVGAGSPIALAGTGVGDRIVTSGWTAGVAADTQVRAVNAIGAGEWSDIKNRTPAGSSGGGDLSIVQVSASRADFGSDLSITFGSNVSAGNHVLAALQTDDSARTFSSTLGTQDSTVTPGGARISGFRTNNVATPATVFEYSLSSGWNFGAGGIEVSGDAPVFNAVFTRAAEGSDSGAARTVEITVAEDNSIALVYFSGSSDVTYTIGGGLTAGTHGVASYAHVACGKFAAGVHNISVTPASSLTMGAIAVFVWSPGA